VRTLLGTRSTRHNAAAWYASCQAISRLVGRTRPRITAPTPVLAVGASALSAARTSRRISGLNFSTSLSATGSAHGSAQRGSGGGSDGGGGRKIWSARSSTRSAVSSAKPGWAWAGHSNETKSHAAAPVRSCSRPPTWRADRAPLIGGEPSAAGIALAATASADRHRPRVKHPRLGTAAVWTDHCGERTSPVSGLSG
jgi:hypothetical protein